MGAEPPAEVAKSDDDFDVYRKRMMLAYRFRPNPLVSVCNMCVVWGGGYMPFSIKNLLKLIRPVLELSLIVHNLCCERPV